MCGRAFGLELLGIKVLDTPTGLLVTDVEDFPNYAGIPEAHEVIARVVLEPQSAENGGR
jgi:hypothetical protein